jgi:hypothetical protein
VPCAVADKQDEKAIAAQIAPMKDRVLIIILSFA